MGLSQRVGPGPGAAQTRLAFAAEASDSKQVITADARSDSPEAKKPEAKKTDTAKGSGK